jgi:hypothetical protein
VWRGRGVPPPALTTRLHARVERLEAEE